MVKNKVRWGIIGCGDVCEKKSGPAFYKSNYSELKAVMRRNENLAADSAKRHRVDSYYTDAEELLSRSDIDAVYIATPPAQHAFFTKLAASFKKAVYVEKPMARNYDECLDMIQSCQEYEIPFYIAYYRRGLPKFLLLEKLVKENRIGRVQSVRAHLHKTLNPKSDNWRVLPEISGG